MTSPVESTANDVMPRSDPDHGAGLRRRGIVTGDLQPSRPSSKPAPRWTSSASCQPMAHSPGSARRARDNPPPVAAARAAHVRTLVGTSTRSCRSASAGVSTRNSSTAPRGRTWTCTDTMLTPGPAKAAAGRCFHHRCSAAQPISSTPCPNNTSGLIRWSAKVLAKRSAAPTARNKAASSTSSRLNVDFSGLEVFPSALFDSPTS